MHGKLDGLGRLGAADTHDNWTTSGCVLDHELGELLALCCAEDRELSGAASRDEAVDAGGELAVDVGLQAGFVDSGAIVCEWGDEGCEDTVELGRHGDGFKFLIVDI